MSIKFDAFLLGMAAVVVPWLVYRILCDLVDVPLTSLMGNSIISTKGTFEGGTPMWGSKILVEGREYTKTFVHLRDDYRMFTKQVQAYLDEDKRYALFEGKDDEGWLIIDGETRTVIRDGLSSMRVAALVVNGLLDFEKGNAFDEATLSELACAAFSLPKRWIEHVHDLNRLLAL